MAKRRKAKHIKAEDSIRELQADGAPKDDDVGHYYEEADLLDKRRRRIVVWGLIAGILLVAAIVYLFVFAGEEPVSDTAEVLGRGIQIYGMAFEGEVKQVDGQPQRVEPTPAERDKHLADALVLFNRVAEDPGSDFDRDTATLYIGLCALHRGNLDEAQQKIEQVSQSAFEPLALQARFTLGSVHLEREQFAPALEIYRELAAGDSYLAPAAKIEQARILALQGENGEAEELLQSVVDEGEEDDPFVRRAQHILDTGEYLTTLVDLIPIEPVETDTTDEAAGEPPGELSAEDLAGLEELDFGLLDAGGEPDAPVTPDDSDAQNPDENETGDEG